MTMITPSYLGETIEYSSLHACRSTLEDPTHATNNGGAGSAGSLARSKRRAKPKTQFLFPLNSAVAGLKSPRSSLRSRPGSNGAIGGKESAGNGNFTVSASAGTGTSGSVNTNGNGSIASASASASGAGSAVPGAKNANSVSASASANLSSSLSSPAQPRNHKRKPPGVCVCVLILLFCHRLVFFCF